MGNNLRGKKIFSMKGVITVFFTLLSVAFLGLLFALVDSARVSGARAQAANITDMGNYSVFGEFERELLERYEIFAVDGSFGNGDFSLDKVSSHLKDYMNLNASPDADGLPALCFDPWQLKLKDCDVTRYALLTDKNGEAFYQQAVAYMRETAATGMLSTLYQYYKDSGKLQTLQEEYGKEKSSSDQTMEQVQQQEEARKKELAQEEEDTGETLLPTVLPRNPLPELAKVISRGILENVCGDADISDGTISGEDLVSRRGKRSGNMNLTEKYSGLSNDLLFREYLLHNFSCYTDQDTKAALKYQLEYIIAGKKSDSANLKSTANRLLLLREGANYVSCLQIEEVNGSAQLLATLLLGWTGIPALVEALHHALLLGWSYGESLLDVRTLLHGGRVPLIKTAADWIISLDNLADLGSILDNGTGSGGEGLQYKDYLRVLLNLQSCRNQRKRGLDMIEITLKAENGLSDFRADNCIVGLQDTTVWKIPAVFSRVTRKFLATDAGPWKIQIRGGFSYDY